jgi:hypothetical protein
MVNAVEKRGTGKDRRINAERTYTGRERRISDRRQIVVLEISFREWATHLIHFRKKLVSRQKRQAERQARKAELKAAEAQNGQPAKVTPPK